jgi:PEP-CTERM/exosortase A-associated glycosyltransferase
MRILHILDHSLPLHSGYSFRTIAILKEQHARGWSTLQLTTPRQGGGQAVTEDADGWRFHRTPLRGTAASRLPGVGLLQEMLATAARIDELAQLFRPHILHAHSPVLNALPALWMGRKHGIPVVYEVRSLWEDAAVDHGTTAEGSVRYRASRWLETFALRRADHVTTICEGLRRDISARGVRADRITVVPNAVDTDAFSVTAHRDAELQALLGLEGKTVLGFAGSFYGYEGLDLLLEAAAKLLPSHPDLRVLLVGGGPQEEDLKRCAAALGLGDRVIFAGRVPHERMSRYYGLVDVLVYPRRRMRLTEIVTPLKPLEAMAQGRMLVASDVGGHRELVRNGETGFLFSAGDAGALAQTVDSLLRRRSDWPRLRHQARMFVEAERTWAQSVTRCAAVYAALCPSPENNPAPPVMARR